MNIFNIIQQHRQHDGRDFRINTTYRLWVWTRQGWQVNTFALRYSDDFGVQVRHGRTHDAFVVERVADGAILASKTDFLPQLWFSNYEEYFMEYINDADTYHAHYEACKRVHDVLARDIERAREYIQATKGVYA